MGYTNQKRKKRKKKDFYKATVERWMWRQDIQIKQKFKKQKKLK